MNSPRILVRRVKQSTLHRANGSTLAREGSSALRALIRVVLHYVVLTLVAGIFVVPLLWLVLSSFKSLNEVLAPKIVWLPPVWQFDNYNTVFIGDHFDTFLKNSIIVALSMMTANLAISSMAGYGLAKFRFRGRKPTFAFILLVMMVPFQVIMIPLYIVVHDFGWINSYYGLIVPGAVTGFGVFFMRQTIMTIPDDMFEAARIDGASEFRIYVRILLPLIVPALAALGVLTFLGSWNNLLWPLLVINSQSLETLPLGLSNILSSQYGVQYNLVMTGAVISILPVVLLFFVARRSFVRGIAMVGFR